MNRLGKLIIETGTKCYAWALMPNHFHLLLKTGDKPISKMMQRLLTGYAITFNRKHRRVGHLFQNRYKSILCQEDIYLKELIRYIHLNPLRVKIVESQKQLDTFSYSGHSTIKGNRDLNWQEVEFVLSLFATTRSGAQIKYDQFMKDGTNQGNREDLIGGGLIRSNGGWDKVKSFRKTKEFLKSDERILGESDFVNEVLQSAQEKTNRGNHFQNPKMTYHDLMRTVSSLFEIVPRKVASKNKERNIVQAR